uniref:Uncharacterized protein n=1 Tax=Anguilla anguilla TaxID=7936 RepID=A0A0E9WLC8_ANGAN
MSSACLSVLVRNRKVVVLFLFHYCKICIFYMKRNSSPLRRNGRPLLGGQVKMHSFLS